MWSNFTAFAAETSFASMALRLLLALISGAIIGIERGLKRRGAGMKTHALVSLGSALVMATGEYTFLRYGEGSADITRIAASVVSGIGFLGVGTIMVTGKNQVRGLTTAAGLWTSACIGIAFGIGFVEGGVLAFAFVMLTFGILGRIDIILPRYSKVFHFYVEFESGKNVSQFISEIHDLNIKIVDFELSKSKIKGDGPNAIVILEIKNNDFGAQLIDKIRSLECVKFIEEL